MAETSGGTVLSRSDRRTVTGMPDLKMKVTSFTALSSVIIMFLVCCFSCTGDDWPPVCEKNERLTTAINGLDAQRWSSRVRMLSGAGEMTVNGVSVISSTRYTPALFSGADNAQAYVWLREQLEKRFPASYIKEEEYRDNYLCINEKCTGWRNIVLSIPGGDLSKEEILVTAHFDSISINDAVSYAPGADDNATGSAALLELSELLSDLTLRRTVKLIWFSGEEQGLVGSSAWVYAHREGHIRGVINLDSIGWNGDSNPRMEINAADDDGSRFLAECVLSLISVYSPALVPELLTGEKAAGNSDHSEFWYIGVPAIMLSEDNCTPEGCDKASSDANTHHHTDGDTWETIDAQYGFDITVAAIATVLSLAELQ